MFDAVFAGLLGAAGISSGTSCSDSAPSQEYHLEDVCAEFFGGTQAYSITFQASLSPGPASQQILVYRHEGVWFMRIAGYRWEPGGEVVVTRRQNIAISDADAEYLVSRLTSDAINELSKLPYYGSETVICTDGASLELAMVLAGQKTRAAQHSCAGRTEISEIAESFVEIALKYDPGFDGLLSGLRR